MPNYKLLFQTALANHNNDPKWDDGKFVGIKTISNTKVGSVGQDFIEGLCGVLKFSCVFPISKKKVRATQSPWDIKINGVSFELKTATEDISGSFQFNHIRYHREYEAVLCLGVTPNKLFFGVWSKADITTGKAGSLVSMEKGANASYKLTKPPKDLFPIAKFQEELTNFIEGFVH